MSHDALGQPDETEAAYCEAVALNRKVPTTIPISFLVDFLVRQDRLNEARDVVVEHLKGHPDVNIAMATQSLAAVWEVFKGGWRDNLVAAGIPE